MYNVNDIKNEVEKMVMVLNQEKITKEEAFKYNDYLQAITDFAIKSLNFLAEDNVKEDELEISSFIFENKKAIDELNDKFALIAIHYRRIDKYIEQIKEMETFMASNDFIRNLIETELAEEGVEFYVFSLLTKEINQAKKEIAWLLEDEFYLYKKIIAPSY